MSTPIAEYDLKVVLALVKITNPTAFDLALIDRYFMIYEGNVRKTADAFLRAVALKESPNV